MDGLILHSAGPIVMSSTWEDDGVGFGFSYKFKGDANITAKGGNVLIYGKDEVYLEASEPQKLKAEGQEIAMEGAIVENKTGDLHLAIFPPKPGLVPPPPPMPMLLMIPFEGEIDDGLCEKVKGGAVMAVEGSKVSFKSNTLGSHDHKCKAGSVSGPVGGLNGTHDTNSPTWVVDGSGPEGKAEIVKVGCAMTVKAEGKCVALVGKSRANTCMMGQKMGMMGQITKRSANG